MFVDTVELAHSTLEELAHSTLEELHDLCRGKVPYVGQAGQVPKVLIHSSMEDISLSLAEDLSSRWIGGGVVVFVVVFDKSSPNNVSGMFKL